MNTKVKKMVMLALFSAVAYLAMVLIHLPLVPGAEYLTFDGKDVIIAISGFIYGPLAALGVASVVGVLEMLTISTTGVIGLVMNVLASAAFACTAALIYKHKSTIGGAVAGLAAGCGLMTVVMLICNYFLTPLYTGMAREAVAAMLIPVFLPFNLIKGVLNATITLLVYKPLVTALRKAKMVSPSESQLEGGRSYGYMVASALVLATCVVAVLSIARLAV